VLGIVKHPGCFSEFFTLPVRNLHVLPDEIPTEEAVFAEPLAAACEILDQVAIPREDQVAVRGKGKLGLLIGQVLEAHGYTVKLFGRQDGVPRAAFNWVVDATGSAEGLRQAVEMVRPRGTVIMKSTLHGMVRLDTAPVVVNEVTLVGSRCGRFEPALELLRSGKIHLAGMISERFPLAEAPRAFARAGQKGVLKVLLSARREDSAWQPVPGAAQELTH
jgi:alcohol dehydrogenase